MDLFSMQEGGSTMLLYCRRSFGLLVTLLLNAGMISNPLCVPLGNWQRRCLPATGRAPLPVRPDRALPEMGLRKVSRCIYLISNLAGIHDPRRSSSERLWQTIVGRQRELIVSWMKRITAGSLLRICWQLLSSKQRPAISRLCCVTIVCPPVVRIKNRVPCSRSYSCSSMKNVAVFPLVVSTRQRTSRPSAARATPCPRQTGSSVVPDPELS
jgi:hypothetical protein